jgi:hypothetical protein
LPGRPLTGRNANVGQKRERCASWHRNGAGARWSAEARPQPSSVTAWASGCLHEIAIRRGRPARRTQKATSATTHVIGMERRAAAPEIMFQSQHHPEVKFKSRPHNCLLFWNARDGRSGRQRSIQVVYQALT